MATLTPQQQAKMSPAAISAWNARQAAYAATQPTAAPPAASTPFNVIPKPNPAARPPAAPPTGGNAPVSTAPFNPLAPPTQQPPVPLNTASMITGVAPTAQAPAMGGNAPATQAGAPPMTTPFPATPGTGAPPTQVYQPNMSAGNVVQDYMTALLDENSGYIQNAERKGIEYAAGRGNINGSLAGQSARRAAIDAAQPILSEITNLHNQREQLAFTGEQNQQDRDQQITMARISDWAANNQFNREYNGQLSLLPITSTIQLNNALLAAAIENPEIFPPEIVSGLSEFFGGNMLAQLKAWFPAAYGG